MAKSRYFYVKPKRVFGPVSSDTLVRLAQEGQLMPDDLVARDGTSKWRIACEIEGLRFPDTGDEPASSQVLGYAKQPIGAVATERPSLSGVNRHKPVPPVPRAGGSQAIPAFHLTPDPEPQVFGDPWEDDGIEISRPSRRAESGPRDALWTIVFVIMGGVTAYGLYYTPPIQNLMRALKAPRGAVAQPDAGFDSIAIGGR